MKTKICSKCKTIKTIDEFFLRNKSTGRRHAQCKKCYTNSRSYKNHYGKYKIFYCKRANNRHSKLTIENTKLLVEYLKSHPCNVCGEKDPIVLDFDHRNPEIKEMTISAMTRNYTWQSILKEIEKCDVLCSNCHRRKTAKQFSHIKYILLCN